MVFLTISRVSDSLLTDGTLPSSAGKILPDTQSYLLCKLPQISLFKMVLQTVIEASSYH